MTECPLCANNQLYRFNYYDQEAIYCYICDYTKVFSLSHIFKKTRHTEDLDATTNEI